MQQETVRHHRHLGPVRHRVWGQGVRGRALQDALCHGPLDRFLGPGRHGPPVCIPAQRGLTADIIPCLLPIAIEEHCHLLAGHRLGGRKIRRPDPLGNASLLRPADGGGIPGIRRDIHKSGGPRHRRLSRHTVEEGDHLGPLGGAVWGKSVCGHPLYQFLLIEVPHCRAIPGLGGDIHKGSVGLLYKHPVGKPIQVYIPRDAGDPPVVRILKPNPAAPVTNGRRLTGPVVCNPQGVAGEFCLPDGGCTVSVGIEHRRDAGAGLQRFRKGQCNGI